MEKRRNIFIIFAALFLLLTFPRVTFAQVVINEFSPDTTPDWVELYNTGSSSISLAGFAIYFDDNLNVQKHNFCSNDSIGGNSYRLINLGANELNKTSDMITLKDGEGNVKDRISYGSGTSLAVPTATQSATRSPDGSSNWIITNSPTPQGITVSFDCPTPTPTSTPTPSSSPAPTSTPTPTPTPTKTPTPKLIATTTQKPIAQEAGSSGQPSSDKMILGLRNQLKTPTPEVLAKRTEKKSFPFVAVFLILGGIACIGGAGWAFYLKSKTGYNDESETNQENL